MLLQIKQNGRCLKYNEIVSAAVYKDGNSPVWIEFDEPRLFLTIGPDVNLLYAGRISVQVTNVNYYLYSLVIDNRSVDGFELFQKDGYLVSIRCRTGVEQERFCW